MVGKIFFLLSALHLFVGKTVAFYNFALCDRQIRLYAGQSRSLRSPYWPAGFMPGSSCRYSIQAPIDYQIQVTCKIDFMDPYQDGSCASGKFYIAEDGNRDITSTQPICGTTTTSRSSLGNKLTLAYTSDYYYSGLYDCQLTAVCDCGWGLNSRIVGGQETAPNEFPSTAALVSTTFEALFCGATIVSSRYVVTAAHCLRKTNPTETAVLVGDHDLTTGRDTLEAKLYQVLEYIEHAAYNNETKVNDIGLVRTILPMVWSRGVGPVCLPFYYANADFSGVDVIGTGWGLTEFGGKKSDYLQKVDLTVLKNSDPSCQRTYPTIQDSQMCTYKEGKDTCQYDSGGGLYYSGLTGSRKFLVAQVSLGEGCGGNSPSLNTRITSYLDWIEKETKTTLCRRTIE
ncbi:venom serine protease-like [Bradysia coprophila]|uniref:venom serine protease-like n=1 Tax=Bradysia coprophila TaxID=38358 RepID=UPI00187DC0E4|nr:venom serine protease-like [Bradysia coprophila]